MLSMKKRGLNLRKRSEEDFPNCQLSWKKSSETASLLLILLVTIPLLPCHVQIRWQKSLLGFFLIHSPPSDVKVNLDRNLWNFVNFSVLKGQLWVLTCIPAAHFSAKSANFSRGLLFLMYRNSRVHPLFLRSKWLLDLPDLEIFQ